MPEQNLNDVSDGSRVFVGTNIFFYHFRGQSAACTRFISRIANREIVGYVNTEVLSDLLHKLMLLEAVNKNIIGSMSASKLKECFSKNRAAASALTIYQQQFESVTKMGLRILPINKTVLLSTKEERSKYALLTTDSLHLGTMKRYRVNGQITPLTDIATFDGDFAHIPNYTVWEPLDIPRKQGATHVP